MTVTINTVLYRYHRLKGYFEYYMQHIWSCAGVQTKKIEPSLTHKLPLSSLHVSRPWNCSSQMEGWQSEVLPALQAHSEQISYYFIFIIQATVVTLHFYFTPPCTSQDAGYIHVCPHSFVVTESFVKCCNNNYLQSHFTLNERMSLSFEWITIVHLPSMLAQAALSISVHSKQIGTG